MKSARPRTRRRPPTRGTDGDRPTHIGSDGAEPVKPLRDVGFATGAVGATPGAQARGSHGWSAEVDEDGAAIAAVGLMAVVVVGAAVDVAAALTVNCVPVTTVTSAPSATWLGSKAMTTEPVIERATSSAAPSTAGLRDP